MVAGISEETRQSARCTNTGQRYFADDLSLANSHQAMRESLNERTFSVDKARLQFVLRGQPVSLVSTLSLAIVTVALMWSSVPHSVLIGWLSVLLIVTALRATLWMLIGSSYFSQQSIAFWRALFISGCALSGSCWGAASLIFETCRAPARS